MFFLCAMYVSGLNLGKFFPKGSSRDKRKPFVATRDDERFGVIHLP